jgi:hypothetical protein
MQTILQENSFVNPITSTATRAAFSNPLLLVVAAGALFYFINRKK